MGEPASSSVIAGLPRSASGRVQAEFSVKITPNGLARFGRFAAWVEADDAAAIAEWLKRVGAPDAVMAAHGSAPAPLRQGAAASIGEGGTEYRLYLHGQSAGTQADDYVGLRWMAGEGEVRRSRYTFHFAPEAPDGARPERLVPAWARDGVAAIADEPMMRRLSGFWLRRDEAGRLDQIDLATPWMPQVAVLAGARQLLDVLGLDGEDRHWVEALPVRHIALPPEGAPGLTLYCAGRLPELPADEPALQEAVIAAAGDTARDIAAFVATLPPQRADPPQRGAIDHFYSGEIALWQAALGPHMHYHHGLFDTPDAPADDAAMLAASRRAVSELYPFIGEGASVYDVGCGWGGPLDMLARERGCRALGVTIARNQFAHVAALGLPVRWADAERTLPPRWFDCMLLLESFEHMRDKPALLRLLAGFTGRLVMRVNCQDQAPASTNFGGSMPMVSSATLRAMLEAAGWRIRHWRDRRAEAMPSAAAWARRLAAIPPTRDHHLETFRHWAPRVEALGAEWGRNNPLIECVAER